MGFAKTRDIISYNLGPKTRDTARGYLKCVTPHIGDPVVRTDGRTVGYQISDGYGYQICLAMVRR